MRGQSNGAHLPGLCSYFNQKTGLFSISVILLAGEGRFGSTFFLQTPLNNAGLTGEPFVPMHVSCQTEGL